MKLEIGLQKLKNALSIVERAVGKNTSLPTLSCILIETQPSSVIFRSTNLELGVEVTVATKTDGGSRLAIRARTLSTFISQIQDQNQIVTMEEEGGNLKVILPKLKTTIKGQPVEDFPT